MNPLKIRVITKEGTEKNVSSTMESKCCLWGMNLSLYAGTYKQLWRLTQALHKSEPIIIESWIQEKSS